MTLNVCVAGSPRAGKNILWVPTPNLLTGTSTIPWRRRTPCHRDPCFHCYYRANIWVINQHHLHQNLIIKTNVNLGRLRLDWGGGGGVWRFDILGNLDKQPQSTTYTHNSFVTNHNHPQPLSPEPTTYIL